MTWIIENWETILSIIGGTVVICSALLKVLPEGAQKYLGILIKVLNFFSTINPKTVKVEDKK